MTGDALDAVARAAADRTDADLAYASAVLAAVERLEAEGAVDPFAQVAAAAGVSRQAVRAFVARARADR